MMNSQSRRLATVVLLLAGVGAVHADENASLSPQARGALAMLQKMKDSAPQEPPAAEGVPLSVEAAQQGRSQMRKLVEPSTQELVKLLKVGVDEERIQGVPVTWLTPQSASAKKGARVIVYIHSGGYVAGTPMDPMIVTLAQETGLRVASIDYRLAPEHPFPAGRDDCVAVYRELVRRLGARNLVLIGGSAGGGMVTATVLTARDGGVEMPLATVLQTPWSDLTRTGDSYYSNEGRDPVAAWRGLAAAAGAYAGGKDLRSPELSPVYADFSRGFPPTLITTGTRDLFLSNSVRLHRALRKAGVNSTLEVWEGMWHSFEGFTGMMPEAQEAMAAMAAFIKNPPIASGSGKR